MQTYIKFARSIKPAFTKESAEILKAEYKRLRKIDAGSQKSSYKITVRQLESLIRLSEAMARLHCDSIIRESYVREVCRLLATSNIQISKGEVYVEDTAAAMNREDRTDQTNLAMPEQPEQPAESTKVKLSYDEYERLVFMIIKVFKDFEDAGEEQIQQNKIVDKVVRDIELASSATSVEKAVQTAKKVSSVIQQLITKENLLMIDQDSKMREERILSLDVNVDLSNMNLNTAGELGQ